jgi:hypothetical protein
MVCIFSDGAKDKRETPREALKFLELNGLSPTVINR